MSRRLSRLAFSSSAAALALVLVVPSAALADDDHGNGGDHGKRDEHGSAGQTDGHNPPGNNGTIKIDYPAPADSGNANRPHPGCAFQLRMFGFDDDQYGTVTFVGQAPTKLGTLLTQTHVLLSDDSAGGGKDVDAVYSYTASQLGLVGQPQAKQGWHVKVSVDADNAPGGAKHKVFWLSCPATTAGTTGTTGGAATATQSSIATKSISMSGAATSASNAATTRSRVAALGAAGAAAAPATTAGAAAATTSAPARGSALPFTGFGLGLVLLLALAVLTAGGLAVVAGRRRTSAL
ncbi:MAG: hypothetical protein QOJ79_464 [Actinomycetota bacterium]|nr:hypothetical protein [Actinomycetota bacterium]